MILFFREKRSAGPVEATQAAQARKTAQDVGKPPGLPEIQGFRAWGLGFLGFWVLGF